MDANSQEAGGILDWARYSRRDLLKPEQPTPDHFVFVLTFCLTVGSGLVDEAAHDLWSKPTIAGFSNLVSVVLQSTWLASVCHDAVTVGKEDISYIHSKRWNACSTALCPYAPHPHLERRYLVVPGLRSTRIYIVDTKPDPTKLQIVKIIEPEEVFSRTGYSRAHTVHCGPEGIYLSALGARDGGGPGGIFLLDHFDYLGASGRRNRTSRGPSERA